VITVPILAWHFGAVPLLGPLTNMIAVPVVAALVPLGMLTLLGACTLPAIAVALNVLIVKLLHLLLTVSALAAALPWAEWRWVLRSPWVVCAYYAGLAVALWLMSRWTHSRENAWPIPAGSEPRMW